MAIRWYTAYRVDPDLLKILITALGIDINTINEDELKNYSVNGFRSLNELLDRIILPEDEILVKLLKELRNNNEPRNINSKAVYNALIDYITFVEKIEENDSFRFIENRKDCYYINAHCKTLSVDTPKDRVQVERYMKENGLTE